MAKSHPSDYLREVAKYLLCQDADERIMRSYEESLGIPEQMADDFRRGELATSQAQALLTEYDPGPYGVVRGSLLTGFEIYGTFNTVEEAADWAETYSVVLGAMTVMPIRPPASCGVTVNKG